MGLIGTGILGMSQECRDQGCIYGRALRIMPIPGNPGQSDGMSWDGSRQTVTVLWSVDLVMAAKNEERRQSEQYQNSPQKSSAPSVTEKKPPTL